LEGQNTFLWNKIFVFVFSANLNFRETLKWERDGMVNQDAEISQRTLSFKQKFEKLRHKIICIAPETMNYLEEVAVPQLSMTTHSHGLVTKTRNPE